MSEFGSYKVNDKRGHETVESCRTCGAPRSKAEPHTLNYNNPTMDCIKYLRAQIATLEAQLPKSQRV